MEDEGWLEQIWSVNPLERRWSIPSLTRVPQPRSIHSYLHSVRISKLRLGSFSELTPSPPSDLTPVRYIVEPTSQHCWTVEYPWPATTSPNLPTSPSPLLFNSESSQARYNIKSFDMVQRSRFPETLLRLRSTGRNLAKWSNQMAESSYLCMDEYSDPLSLAVGIAQATGWLIFQNSFRLETIVHSFSVCHLWNRAIRLHVAPFIHRERLIKWNKLVNIIDTSRTRFEVGC